eukprot:NODE_101_length_19951_cov_0.932501.p11 type:complete len:225 gc:universal NODE_101_length_19951_cov_0.932501:4117-4791(+)
MHRNLSIIEQLPDDILFTLFRYVDDVDLICLSMVSTKLQQGLKKFESLLQQLKRNHLVYLFQRKQRPTLDQLVPNIVPGNSSLILSGNISTLLFISVRQKDLAKKFIRDRMSRKLSKRPSPDSISHQILPKIYRGADSQVAKAVYQISKDSRKNNIKAMISMHLMNKKPRWGVLFSSIEKLLRSKLSNGFDVALQRFQIETQLLVCPPIKSKKVYFESLSLIKK